MMKTRRPKEPSSFCLALTLAALSAFGCSSSPLGPEISRPDPSATGSGGGVPTAGAQPSAAPPTTPSPDGEVPAADPAPSAPAPADPAPSAPAPADPAPSAPAPSPAVPPVCAESSTRRVWYSGAAVSHVVACDQTVTAATISGAPFSVSTLASGTSVNLSGTAGVAAVTAWTATVNALTSVGLTTTVLSSAGLDATLLASATPTYDTVTDLTFRAVLGATWDGSMGSVDLDALSIATDLHGVDFYSSCSSAVASYVCNDVATTPATNTKDGQLKLRWKFSAFDQGAYYLDVNPRLTIESVQNDLALDTLAVTVPIQTNGNVSINYTGTPTSGSVSSMGFPITATIAKHSTPTAPKVGVVYPIQDTNDAFVFKELAVDRTDDPSGGASGVTQGAAAGCKLHATDNLLDLKVEALASGQYAVAGTNSDDYNLGYRTFSSGAVCPARIALTTLPIVPAKTEAVLAVALSEPFTDTVQKIGLASVLRNVTDSQTYLIISKLTPTGTTKATIVADADYDTMAINKAVYNTTGDVDRLRMRWISESGVGFFYVAFREDTSIKVLRLRSTKGGAGVDYDDDVATLATGVLEDTDLTGNDYGTLDMAVGRSGGNSIVGVVYRSHADSKCYWRRFRDGANLGTAPLLGDALAISTGDCYFPTVHYVTSSGRFVVTYVDKPAGGNYEIRTRDITVDTATPAAAHTVDSAGTVTTIFDTGSATIQIGKMSTAYYPEGNWMSVVYRKNNNTAGNVLKVHGFHVRGR